MSQTGNIKLKIRDLLLELVDAGTLADVIVLRKPISILNLDTNVLPAAILANSSFSGAWATNRDNEIINTFDIMVIDSADNINTDTYLEDLSEAIRRKIADNETLGGLSLAIEPISSPFGPISEVDHSKVFFILTLKVHSTETLT